MIVRIVHLQIKELKCSEFEQIFNASNKIIESYEGCTFVKLYRDIELKNHYYTYSVWESLEHLNAYRDSEFFRATWKTVKEMFQERARAISLEELNSKY